MITARLIIAFITLTLSASAQYNHCKETINEGGVRVFSCVNPQSNFRSVIAQFDVDVSIDTFTRELFDIPSYVHWQYKTINPRILERRSVDDIIYYAEIVSPWPFHNRDLIAWLRRERDSLGQVVRFIYRGLPNYLPPNEGIMRIPSSASDFQVEALGANKVRVVFYSTIDPGGSVPAWMMNLVGGEGPLISFTNLKARLERR